jgi:hypothetical protein
MTRLEATYFKVLLALLSEVLVKNSILKIIDH